MNPFEKGLRSEIPLEAAADFFMKLKYGSAGVDAHRAETIAKKMANAAEGYGSVPNAGAPPPAPLMQAAKPAQLPPTAMGQQKMAERFRKAAADMFGEGMTAPGSIAPQVDMSQYLAMEEMGADAEQSNQAEFLRAKLEAANAELQSAKDQAMQSQQMQQTLQMQQSQHEQQLQAAQQQAQLATQAAMQNVDQAHQLAMKATSAALQAKDDAISTHQMAAQMRMSYQDLRGSIMDAVAQDAAAPVGEAIKQKGMESQTNMMPDQMGQDPNAAPEAGLAGEAAGAQPGPAAASSEGTPSESGADTGAGGEQEPAGEEGQSEEQPSNEPKTAGLGGDVFSAAMGHLKQRAPHMAAGALIGGGLSAAESQMGTEGMEADLAKTQQEPDSFGKALRVAAQKMGLEVRKGLNEHPIAGTLAGAATGAGMGASMGPGLVSGLKKLPERMKTIAGR